MSVKFEKIYSSMSSAKRGVVRAGLQTPVYTKQVDGKILVTVAKAVNNTSTRATVSTVSSPVAKFREIFSKNYGTVRRKDLIALAVKGGVSRGTAATYYQKLAAVASSKTAVLKR